MGGNRLSRWVAAAGVALAVPLTFVAGATSAAPTITQFSLPAADSVPVSIVTGSDGRLWFTEANRNYIGRIPSDATGTSDIEEIGFGILGEDPYGAAGIANARDGSLWFTMDPGLVGGNPVMGRVSLVGTPGFGHLQSLSEADSQPRSIATGRDGNLWFTRGTGNKVGRISPASPYGDAHFLIPPPPGPPGPAASPRGITLGPDGNMWFTQAGRNLIGRLTTGVTPSFTNFQTTGSPRGITAGPDGNLWFTQPQFDRVARITPAGAITEFNLPDAESNPTEITSGPDGKIWFSETGGYLLGEEPGNRIGRLDPAGTDDEIQSSLREFTLPSTRSSPTGITTGPDGAIWFTQANGNRIGRITTELDPPTVRTSPEGPPITIPSAGTASSYPAELDLSVPGSEVTRVRVDLYGLFHTWPEDLDLLLVGPEGQKAMLVSDAGFDRSVFGSTLSIDDQAPRPAPENGILTIGRYLPTDIDPGETMPAPAPAGPYGTSLSVFNGTNPNGTWRLFVNDDSSLASGRLLGWGLRVESQDPPVDPPIEPPVDPPVDPPDLPATARGGFVKGLRQVLVNRAGRAMIELACPPQQRTFCRIALKGPVKKARAKVRQGKVRLVRVKLPGRLRDATLKRQPKVRLKARDLGGLTTRPVRLKRVSSAVRLNRKGTLRVLVPHAGDARRLRVRLKARGKVAAVRLVKRIARGRVKALRLTLKSGFRRRPVSVAVVRVTTIPKTGPSRVLAYRIRIRR